MKKSILIPALLWSVGANAACPANKASDILNCAITDAPAVSIAKIRAKASRGIPNPELEFGAGYNGEDSDIRGMQYDAALMFQIESSAKRSGRTGAADADLSATQSAAAVSVLSAANRLRQIADEKKALSETIRMFGAIIANYDKRPALSPDDRISLSIFISAKNNHDIELRNMEFEELNLRTNLSAMTGSEIPANPFLFAPKKYPDVARFEVYGENPELKRLAAESAAARAGLYPGVRIGPYIQTRPSDVGRIDNYGIKVSVPLPFFSGYGSVSAANQELSFARTSQDLELSALKEKYNSGIEALGKINLSDLEKSHAVADKAFGGGRVNPSLFIEAHRQFLDGIKTYHEYEMETLQNLWRIYALAGKLLSNLEDLYHE